MKRLNISDIVSQVGVYTDGDWVESKDQNPKGSVRLIQLADIGDGYFVNKSKRYLTKEAANRLKCTFLKRGDILIARMPDPIGRACIFPDIDQEAVTVVDVCVVRPENENVFTPFVKYLVNSPTFRHKISKHVTGTTRKRISRKNLNKIDFVLPSLKDQKRIAKVLYDNEQLIQWRKQSIKLLDDYLESTFLEMFGDPVANDRKWKLVPLQKFGTIDRGVSKHRPRNAPKLLNGDHPLIQTGDVSNSGTYIESYKRTYSDFGLKQSKKWPTGTLCITIAANIAKTGILRFDACFPDSVVGFVADPKEATNLYVHHLFSFFQKILERNAPAAAQRNINLSILRSLKVPQPPIETQLEFDLICKNVEIIRIRCNESLSEIQNLYNSISQQAFKGKLDLRNVEIKDSPSSVSERSAIDNDLKKRDKEQLKKIITKKNVKKDIRTISLMDFLKIPFELYKDKIAEDYGPELDFINDDLFYQFYLKDNFDNLPFTFTDLQNKFNSYYIPKGKDFDPVKWKSIIFKYLEAKEPLLKQSFEEESGTIKLELTDEAFKA